MLTASRSAELLDAPASLVETLLAAQKQSLEMVVQGAPLAEVLAYLTRVVEDHAPGEVTAAILVLDAEGRLWTGAAPGLPDDFNRAIDGLRARADLGTCSIAAVTGATVVTPDIAADPCWAPLKALPLGLGLKAAWSQPIVARDGRILGTFGTYFRECRRPTPLERRLVETLSQTAALAIERKQADERQLLLLNELNHRVKNTLATVQSIARQTLRSTSDIAAAGEAIDSRVMSLARAHDILTVENWAGADLAEVVARAVEPFGARDRFEVAGPSVRLAPRQALALAMALHELATNAAKYGALSAPEGIVSLRWSVTEAPRTLVFAWRERGGPPVSPPARKGFGSRLLERGLAGELGGRTRLDYAPGGLACEITAPL